MKRLFHSIIKAFVFCVLLGIQMNLISSVPGERIWVYDVGDSNGGIRMTKPSILNDGNVSFSYKGKFYTVSIESGEILSLEEMYSFYEGYIGDLVDNMLYPYAYNYETYPVSIDEGKVYTLHDYYYDMDVLIPSLVIVIPGEAADRIGIYNPLNKVSLKLDKTGLGYHSGGNRTRVRHLSSGHNGSLFVTSRIGAAVIAVDRNSGNVLWSSEKINIGSQLAATGIGTSIGPGGVVYLSTSGGVSALDRLTGSKLWSQTINDFFYANTDKHYWYSTPSIGEDGTVFLGTDSGKVLSIDGADGRTNWEIDFGYNVKMSSPSIGLNDMLYVAASNSRVYAIKQSSGEKLWEFKGESSFATTPVVGADGTLYAATEGGRVYAIDSSGQSAKWTYYVGERIDNPPILTDNGILLVTSRDGRLHAIKAHSGPAESAWPMYGQNAQGTSSLLDSGIPDIRPPIITSGKSQVYVENSDSKLITTLTATDGDGDEVNFSLIGGADISAFILDSDSGELSFKDAPDFEAPGDVDKNNKYKVIIEATDGKYPVTKSFEVSIQDVEENPNPPVFTSPSQFTYLENSSGLGITTVSADDPDGNSVAYSISGGEDMELFSIEGSTGELSFFSPPEYEMPWDNNQDNRYQLEIQASDGTHQVTQFLTIAVADDPSDGGKFAPGFKIWEIEVEGFPRPPTLSKQGTVYVIVSDKLYALDGGDGTLKWEFIPDTGRITTRPILSEDGTVFIGTGRHITSIPPVNSKVMALDGETGAVKWEFEFQTTLPVSHLALDSSGYLYASLAGNSLFSIDATTGLKRWETTVGNNGGRIFLMAVGVDGTVFVLKNSSGLLFDGESLYAIDREDGAILWTYVSDSFDHYYDIAVGLDNTLYISTATHLTAINSSTGIEKWRVETWDVAKGIPPVSLLTIGDGGRVYLQSIDEDDYGLLSYHPNTGEIWDDFPLMSESGLREELGPYLGGTTIGSDGTLYSKFHAIDASTGAIKHNYNGYGKVRSSDSPPKYGSFYSSPILSDEGILYFSSSDGSTGTISAFQGSSGPALTAWPMEGQNAQGTGQAAMGLPSFKSPSTFSKVENTSSLSVGVIELEKLSAGAVSYSINGGTDMAHFTLDSVSGLLSFRAEPDYENPEDVNGDNIFEVTVVANDGKHSIPQHISVYLINNTADDPKAGDLLWEFQTGGNVFSSPSIGRDGTVYFGSWDKKVYAVDGKTGEKKWEFPTGGWVSARPLVGNDGKIYVGSYDNTFYGINAETGTKEWGFNTGGLIFSSSSFGPNSDLFFGSWDGFLYSLGREDGLGKWAFPTDSQVTSSPVVGPGSYLYFGSDNHSVFALDKSTGVKAWEHQTSGKVIGSPALGIDGTVYIGGADANLYALDGNTGELAWKYATGGQILSTPAVSTDDVIYFGSADKNVYALDGEEGSVLWTYQTGGSIRSSPAIAADGTIYIGSHDQNLYALNGQTGDVIWKFEAGGGIDSSPAISPDGTVFVGAADGKLYAIKGNRGPADSAWPEAGYVANAGVFGNEVDLGYGWKSLDWLGIYYTDPDSGYIYHEHLGWIYPSGRNKGSFWVYLPSKGWIWTSSNLFPMFYQDSTKEWVSYSWFEELYWLVWVEQTKAWLLQVEIPDDSITSSPKKIHKREWDPSLQKWVIKVDLSLNPAIPSSLNYLLYENGERLDTGSAFEFSLPVNLIPGATVGGFEIMILDGKNNSNEFVEVGKNYTLPLGSNVSLEMIWVEPGTFMMGSPASEPGRGSGETQHEVILTKGFWLGKYEVTQAQWREVMGTSPSYFQDGDNLPVEWVSWDKVNSFCALLNEQESDEGRIPEGYIYQLPTEAQWEYACRAGSSTVTAYGDSLSVSQANFKDSSFGQTVDVGSYEANGWGFYDMHGNVWEWCQDWFGDYPGGSLTDPAGPLAGTLRVHRGGSWHNGSSSCRSATRNWYRPDDRSYNLGFRLCLSPIK